MFCLGPKACYLTCSPRINMKNTFGYGGFRPNALVQQVGLEQFLRPDTVRQMAVDLMNLPVLLEGRFLEPHL